MVGRNNNSLTWIVSVGIVLSSIIIGSFSGIIVGPISVKIPNFYIYIIFGIVLLLWVTLEIYKTLPNPTQGLLDELSPNINAPVDQNPSSLLISRYRVIPFSWEIRQNERIFLQDWCFNKEPFSIALFIGSGGSGKTRLFIEWSEKLRKERWKAGFLKPHQHLNETNGNYNLKKSTFVVIDYAESLPNLLPILSALNKYQPSKKKVLRIALLARGQTEWWYSLLENETYRDISNLLIKVPVFIVSEVSVESNLRKKIFTDAYNGFKLKLNTQKPIIEKDLNGSEFSQPLNLHLAALNLLLGNEAKSVQYYLLDETLAHERTFWMNHFNAQLTTDTERQVFRVTASFFMALVTLRGGIETKQEAELLYTKIAGPSPFIPVEVFLTFFHRLYSSNKPKKYLNSLEPDLLGEQLVLSTMKDPSLPYNFIEIVLDTSNEAIIFNAFMVLGRISTHALEITKKWIISALMGNKPQRYKACIFAAVTLRQTATISIFVDILTSVIKIIDDIALVNEIETFFLSNSNVLVSVEVATIQTQLSLLDNKPTSVNVLQEKGRLLNNLGLKFWYLGHREVALSSILESIEIYRKLADRNIDVLPELDTCFKNLSKCLNGLGRRSDALIIDQQKEKTIQLFHSKKEINVS